jgi:hypothetical protein
MALSAAYFVGDIQIPNISGSTVIETANLLNLQIAILKYETVYLKWLLGDDFYAEYAAGIAATVPESRWTALRDQIYQVNSTLGIGISPAANYVYFMYQKVYQSVTTTNGEYTAKHENMELFSPAEKMVAAWNDMVRMSNDIQTWLAYDHVEDYPTLDLDSMGVFEPINAMGI